MSGDRVLIPLPGVGTLALSREAFEVALAEGSRAIAAPATATDAEPLLDAEQLSAQLGNVPLTWIEAAGRDGRIPSIEFGRWRRFRRSAVEAALAANGKGARA
jgi:excisionase family DNA binding protein